MTDLNIIVHKTKSCDASGAPLDVFVAVGVEHFLVGQGNTIEEAERMLSLMVQGTALVNALAGQVVDGNPLASIGPAPKAYHDKLAKLKAANAPSICMPTVQDVRPIAFQLAA